MKSNKGVTLTSLIIYIIGLIIIIGIMNTFFSYFYSNVNEVTLKNQSYEQYIKFLSYITTDMNSQNIVTIKVGDKYIQLKLSGGTEHQYVYQDGIIYYLDVENGNINKAITLCKDVSSCQFESNGINLIIQLYIQDEYFNVTLNS